MDRMDSVCIVWTKWTGPYGLNGQGRRDLMQLGVWTEWNGAVWTEWNRAIWAELDWAVWAELNWAEWPGLN